MISLNNAILLCEFLNCKRIIIKRKKNNFIKDKIFYQKYNLTIESRKDFKQIGNNSIIISLNFLFFNVSFSALGKVNRFDVFRKEILNNLPEMKINYDELYIYIRAGDLFKNLNKSGIYYAQPPLCFYKTILNQFIFRKINIISENTLNPVIPLLLKEYPFIQYKKNNIKIDISYLVYSFNIVSATSTFITSIIKLNKNLKFLWEYDFYILSERYLHLHYSVYDFSDNM